MRLLVERIDAQDTPVDFRGLIVFLHAKKSRGTGGQEIRSGLRLRSILHEPQDLLRVPARFGETPSPEKGTDT